MSSQPAWATRLLALASRLTKSDSVVARVGTEAGLKAGGQYGETSIGSMQAIGEQLAQQLPERPVVRDVGCGTGLTLYALACCMPLAIVQGFEVSADRHAAAMLAGQRIIEQLLRELEQTPDDRDLLAALLACLRIELHLADGGLADPAGCLPASAIFSFDISWDDETNFDELTRRCLGQPCLVTWSSARLNPRRAADLPLSLATQQTCSMRFSHASFTCYTWKLQRQPLENERAIRVSENLCNLSAGEIVQHARERAKRYAARMPVASKRARRSEP